MAQGSDFAYPNRYSSMAETLFDMMDAMSSAYQKRKNTRNSYSSQWDSQYPRQPWNAMPGMRQRPSIPGYPYSRPYRAPSVLDGSWEGSTGEVLIIRRGRFRIYKNRNQYMDGQVKIQGNWLQIITSGGGRALLYEFVEEDGRLVLRDTTENFFLYRRISRN